MATHHLPPELLLDYANGSLAEAASLVVATHLALCPLCRAEVDRLEQLGGAILEQQPVQAMSEACRDKMMALIDSPHHSFTEITPEAEPILCRLVPAPLRSYLGCGLDKVEWRTLTPSVKRVKIGCSCHKQRAQLVRIKAGAKIPRHTHQGVELVLVLAGSVRDGDKLYRRGDVAVCDSQTVHSPVSGVGEDCVCLVVTEAPLCFSGFLSRTINRLIKF